MDREGMKGWGRRKKPIFKNGKMGFSRKMARS
jgi:hypothetical protein